jgi:predicted nucleic acid-binding protein
VIINIHKSKQPVAIPSALFSFIILSVSCVYISSVFLMEILRKCDNREREKFSLTDKEYSFFFGG